MRADFDKGKDPNLHKRKYLNDVHCIPGVLKYYFRQVKPLLTDQYEELLSAAATEEGHDKLIKFKNILQNIRDETKLNIIRKLFHHLNFVSEQTDIDMGASNLATIWAPNLLEFESNREALWQQFDVLQYIIENATDIFGRKEEQTSSGVQTSSEVQISSEVQTSSEVETVGSGGWVSRVRKFFCCGRE